MPPSSTSSSEARPPRRWNRFAFLLVVLIGSAELALTSPLVRGLLPPRTHYYHPVITTRLDALERLVAEHERVDVLFVGSSTILTNIDPLHFDRLVATRARGVVSFNAGLPGLWPVSVSLYAEHVWLPVARPRVVVQGIRYAELAATTHAKHETQVWSGHIEPSWRDADWSTRLYAAAVKRIHLLQYRGAAVSLLQKYRHGWVDDDEGDSLNPYDTRGYEPRPPANTAPATWQPDLPNDGVCGEEGCSIGFAALRRTIAAARRVGSRYVLVNVPEHASRWRGPDARERYRDYLRRLQEFASSEGVAFVDPTEGDPFRFANVPYHDLAHMAAAGARQFTAVVANRIQSFVIEDPQRARFIAPPPTRNNAGLDVRRAAY
jgi:hypothetical protein